MSQSKASLFNPLIPIVKPWVSQNFVTFDCILYRTLKSDHSFVKLLSSSLLQCCLVLVIFENWSILDCQE